MLQGPFATIRELYNQPLACTPIPNPVQGINDARFYTDPAYSVIDPVALAKQQEITKPLIDFLTGIEKDAAEYRRGHGIGDVCALKGLD